MDYVTLATVRAYLKLGSTETADDALLQTFIAWANQTLDGIRRGDARYETRHYDYPIREYDPFGVYDTESWVAQMNAAGMLSQGHLMLDDDLLALAEVENGDGNTIPLTDLITEPPNIYPKHILRIKQSSSYRWLPSSDGDREQVVAVTGWWGYHPQYGSAWSATDAVQDDPLAIAATSISVADASNFQAGQLLKLESELVEITAINTTTDVLTVTRAVNGTTAAQHAQTTTIYRYIPWGNYELAAIRLVVWRYRQKDADVFEKTTSFETGTTIIPAAIPADIQTLLPPRRMVSL